MICKKPNTQTKTMTYTVTKKWAREFTYFSKLYCRWKKGNDKGITSAYEPSGPAIRLAVISPVSVAWSDLEHFYFYLDGMLVLNGRDPPQNSICWNLFVHLQGQKRGKLWVRVKVPLWLGLHISLDVFFLVRSDMQCFYQSTPLWESHIAIRDGPQKNEKRANSTLAFYKTASSSRA